MELANMTYRSSDNNNGTVSDSEISNRGKETLRGRNLPVYLLEDGRLPGIPKGRKVRKRKSKPLASNSTKSYEPIDTQRTDFSKMSSDIQHLLNSSRTDDSGLDLSILTPHISSSRQSPCRTDGAVVDLLDASFQMAASTSRQARSMMGALSPQRLKAQSDLGIAHSRNSRHSKSRKGRRTSHGRIEPSVTSDSAPPSGRSATRTKNPLGTRAHQSSQGKRQTCDNLDYEPNPDVAPFQPANFMSSTILKKVPIPKRHLDTFGGYEYNFIGRRGVMLHTDRYQVDFIKSFDGMSQRERLQAGLDYMEAMRGTRRRRELIPHRAQLDLIMGGKQIEFEERFDIAREIQKLKAVALPKHAKDLFHGRGIHLPSNHLSMHPRLLLPNDLEDELMTSAPPDSVHHGPSRAFGQNQLKQDNYALQQLPPLERTSTQPSFTSKGVVNRSQPKLMMKHPQLPGIRSRTDEGEKDRPHLSMSRERRTVSNLSARLGLYSTKVPWYTLEANESLTVHHNLRAQPGNTTVPSVKVPWCTLEANDSLTVHHNSQEQPGLHRDVTSLSRSQTQAPPPSRVTTGDPATMLARGTSGLTSVKKPQGPVDVRLPNTEAKDDTKSTAPSGTHRSSPVPTSQPGASGVDVAPGTPVQGTPGTPAQSSHTIRAPNETSVRPSTDDGKATPHPLRGADLITAVPQAEQETLRQTFERLDTDADGHLKFQQVKLHLPKYFSREQEKFTEEVYNMSSSLTFFGIEEFMIMDRLSTTVGNLTERAAESFSTLDFATLPSELLKYVGKFDEADAGHRGKISLEALRGILSQLVSPAVATDAMLWENIQNLINTDSSQVSKIEFIAHIPLYLDLWKHGK